MAGSILIIGGNIKQRLSRVEEITGKTFEKMKERPDFLIIENEEGKKSIGIKQIRTATKFLQEKPYEAENKYVIVTKAERLTTQAQNAFLKTLEEPPTYATIILLTRSEDYILETVISRCKKIQIREIDNGVGESEDLKDLLSLRELMEMTPGERLDWATEISKEETEVVISLLESWIMEGRTYILVKSDQVGHINVLKQIMNIKLDLEKTNVNKKLALEALVINI